MLFIIIPHIYFYLIIFWIQKWIISCFISIIAMLKCGLLKRIVAYVILVFLHCQFILGSVSGYSVDSILHNIVSYAPLQGICADEFRADLYMKARVDILKKNVLINLAPFMFKQQKGVSEYMMESFSELHYTAPNIYDQKIKAYYGTVVDIKNFREEIIDYFQVNVYSTTLLNAKLISPLSPMAKKYYTYNIDSLYSDRGNGLLYKIIFTPKNKSYQLVEGYMLVCESTWSVRELSFKGKSEYHSFENRIQMGEVGTEKEYLPVRHDLNTSFHLLGNLVNGYFVADFNYKSITKKKEICMTDARNDKYDLTESFILQNDTSAFLRLDSATFNRIRPIPLTDYEKQYYCNYAQSKNKADQIQIDKTWNSILWDNVEDLFVKKHTIHLPQSGSIRFSEILNPFLFSYSGNNGLSYRHKIRYRHTFKGDRLLSVNPVIGYNFKFEEFYWQIPASLDYWPKKRASFHFDIGNGNRIYGSDVLDELKEMPDSIFDFDKIKLDYFKNFYVDFFHRVEVVNGLSVDVGISFRKRTALEKSTNDLPEVPVLLSDSIPTREYKNKYKSFAPRLRVSWTPKQYYYRSGDRKVNIYSRWPTFSFDYERGIKGVFGGDGEYERMEIDMQHHIPLGLMRNLYYRVGTGAFTDQEDMYFADFVNFSKNNLPTDWNDEIGGVFQLLDRRWYNASRKYVRANLTYEAPFLIMPFLLKRTPNVLNERIYAGVLCMPHLNPYIEIGYGIGTHIFDFGLFVANSNGKFNDVGFKFTIELFNR